jgi:hypothetical protein
MVDALDDSGFFELVDEAGHCTESKELPATQTHASDFS